MTAKVRIELNHSGVAALLKSPEGVAIVRAHAERIAADATAHGGIFEYDAIVGRNRARAMVWTADAEARRAEAIDRTLTRAVGSRP